MRSRAGRISACEFPPCLSLSSSKPARPLAKALLGCLNFHFFFFFFSFIMKQFLHIYWPLVPSHARQRDKKNNDEALTSRPKWVVCLWLWVAIPGMSWLHLSVTHCFQDNHSEQGVGSSCSSRVIYRKRSP